MTYEEVIGFPEASLQNGGGYFIERLPLLGFEVGFEIDVRKPRHNLFLS